MIDAHWVSPITLPQLTEAIEAATYELKICVPSSDYYARPGDTTIEHVSVIDPQRLVAILRGEVI